MDFEADPLIEQISRREKKDTFGLIVCALFHQPKPVAFAEFYHRLVDQLRSTFTADEKQAVYIYPIAHLHITIATLHSFKNAWPPSAEISLAYWKERFTRLKNAPHQGSFSLTLNTIELSPAAGYFQFQDHSNGMGLLRRAIEEHCQPEMGEPKLHVPNIVHSSFLRFVKKLSQPAQFEEKFVRICKEVLANAADIRLDIKEVCLAYESHPYMHIDCDEAHVLDILKY